MMIKKTVLSAASGIAVFLFFGYATLPAIAGPAPAKFPAIDELRNAADGAGLDIKNDVPTYVSYILQGLFGVLGIIFLVLMLYGGMRWMMSQGNDTEVKGARDTLVSATIGLVVVVASYAVTSFIVDKLINKAIGK